MKKSKLIKLLASCFCIAVFGCTINSPSPDPACTTCQTANGLDSLLTPISEIEAAYANQDSNVSVTVKGVITAILSDDTVGGKHQRFIIQLSNGQTLLIAHNVDIGSRVVGIVIGSTIYVHGDYIWNSQGGLIHWTHRDPNGIHENGWIVFGHTKYE
jgi:hypothetical protein